MVLGKMKRSRRLFASLLCAAALGCAQDEPNNGQPGPGAGGQPAGGTSGGSPVLTGDGGVPPGTAGGPGGGTTGGAVPGGGTTGGGTTGGGMTGGGPIPQVDAGPPDLGMNSQGDTFFRADTMVLVKPAVVYDVLGLDVPVTGEVQNIINSTLTTDGNADGKVDASLLIRFLKTVAPGATAGQATFGGGQCPLPLAPDKPCGPEQLFPFQVPSIAYNNAQNCTLEETTEVAAGACFASVRTPITINVPLLGPVALQDGQVIGSWQEGSIVNGRVRGFLSKSVAANTKLQQGIAGFEAFGLSQGAPVVDFLPDAEVVKNSRGEDGWWFVISYTAKPALFAPSATQP